eukprot:344250-Rhodomonas_salina.3
MRRQNQCQYRTSRRECEGRVSVSTGDRIADMRAQDGGCDLPSSVTAAAWKTPPSTDTNRCPCPLTQALLGCV